MSLKAQLITLLADGKFHSGEELGKQLNVSRSAIWKTLQEFIALDIPLISIKGRGYQIPGGLELLDSKYINAHLSPKVKSKINIEILPEISSTNQYLLEQQKYKASGAIVFAEYQTHGRGRRHRRWVSPYGANLYFSILWSFDKDPSELSGLSLAVGVAVVHTLERYGVYNIQLKWPNDILWNYRKLAGVLIEMTAETYSSTHVIIGIGLNLKMPTSINIDQQWIDIATILQRDPERNKIASILIEEIIEVLEKFQHKGFSAYFKHWQALDASFGLPVKLSTPTQEFYGVGNGINRYGEFLLHADEKEIRFLHGEISLNLLT